MTPPAQVWRGRGGAGQGGLCAGRENKEPVKEKRSGKKPSAAPAGVSLPHPGQAQRKPAALTLLPQAVPKPQRLSLKPLVSAGDITRCAASVFAPLWPSLAPITTLGTGDYCPASCQSKHGAHRGATGKLLFGPHLQSSLLPLSFPWQWWRPEGLQLHLPARHRLPLPVPGSPSAGHGTAGNRPCTTHCNPARRRMFFQNRTSRKSKGSRRLGFAPWQPPVLLRVHRLPTEALVAAAIIASLLVQPVAMGLLPLSCSWRICTPPPELLSGWQLY